MKIWESYFVQDNQNKGGNKIIKYPEVILIVLQNNSSHSTTNRVKC